MVLKYYDDMKDVPIYDLLGKYSINNENKLMDLSDSIWQDFLDTGRSTVAYIIFYQGGTIDYGTHVPGPVAQSNAESEYNAECTAGMSLSCFRKLIHEFLNEDPDIVSE